MSYTNVNFTTKKALKEAVARGEKITLYNPGMGTVNQNGNNVVEGPHFPAAHTWYASVELRDGFVTKVK